jgi:hypothetical protein
MYGTVAKIRVKPENRDKLRDVFKRQTDVPVAGFQSSYVLWENEGDTGWIFVLFDDRASYDKNADDPAQHERYTEYRELMESEPEWHDGQIEAG